MTQNERAAPAADPPASHWRLVAAVLAVALLVCLVGGALLWRDRSELQEQVRQADRTEQAETAAKEAAINAMVRMTTYHHSSVEDDYRWVEELGTAEFEETWRPASEDAVKLIRAVKASAEGDVIDAAAEAIDEQTVRVLLFTDQELRQRGTERAELEETRVVMTMVRQDDRWLVDDVEVQNFFADSEQPGGAPTDDTQPE